MSLPRSTLRVLRASCSAARLSQRSSVLLSSSRIFASSSLSSTPSVPSLARAFATTQTRRADAQAAEPEKQLDDGEQHIHDLLQRRFKPAALKVQDVSGGCGSFYAITIASRDFAGKPTVAAHRMVNETLAEVIKGIHGLQLKTVPVVD